MLPSERFSLSSSWWQQLLKSIPWLLLVLSLFTTIAVWRHSKQLQRAKSAVRWERELDRTESAIVNQISTHKGILYNLQAWFVANPEVTRNDWDRYANALAAEKRYPNFHTMGFAAYIDRQRLAAFEASVRADGVSDYRVNLSEEAGDYFAVKYSTRLEKDSSDLGSDFGSHPSLRVAAEMARDTGSIAISDRLQLGSNTGVFLFLPVYRNGEPGTVTERRAAIIGWVYGFWDFQRAIASAIEEENPLFALEIKDSLTSSSWYRSADFNTGSERETKAIEIEEITLTLDFSKLPAFNQAIARLDPMWVLVGSLIISCLVFGMSWSIITARYRGMVLANQMTEVLRDREERLRAIVTNAPVLLFALNRNGVFTLVEGSNLDVTGGQMGEVVGMSIFEIYRQQPQLLEAYRRVLAGESIAEIARLGELTFDFRWSPLLGYNGKIFGAIAIVTDITKRQQLIVALQRSEAELKQKADELQQTLNELASTQTQLIQTEKLSALGQLVAGVAHEINNPINFISGNISYANNYARDIIELLELYQQKFPNSGEEIAAKIEEIELDFIIEDLQKLLGSMRVGTDRIRDIVLSLRTFSRVEQTQFKAVDIHEGIDSTLLILNHRLKAKSDCPEIQLYKEFSLLPLVECYPGQLNQVFMNILANGIDALEEYYSSSKIEPQIWIRTEVIKGSQVAIRIADNGPGIPDDVKNRLFDPFFTTKPVGKGTGLGLSISYQIVVEKHRGQLQCISTPGGGTEFIIEIPIRQLTEQAA